MLRNTELVIGVAVYTGHETKIMKNSPNAVSKRSNIEVKTNKYIIYTVAFQVFVCLVAAIYSTLKEEAIKDNYNYWYLDIGADTRPVFVKCIISFFVWFVALINLVPLCLIVTLEGVKALQAFFIQMDYMIYDTEKDMEARV